MYAQPYYGPPGINGTPQPGLTLEFTFSYVYDVTLTALQLLTGAGVPINTDADFELRTISVAAGSGFRFRLFDSNTQARFSDFVDAALLRTANVQTPFPIFPSIVYPAGSRIGLDIRESANVGTDVQLVFSGVKLFKSPVVTR